MAGNWNDDDKKKIFEAFSVALAIQNSFGKEIDAKATLKAWEFVMADEYNADQVVGAVYQHVKQSTAFPTPADLIKIINPPQRKVTQSEYIAAQKYQEANGWPRFSPEAYLIREYEAQDREPHAEPLQIADSIKERLLLK